MKTETQLNDDILKITLMIREKCPELSTYISEMPVTVPNVESPEINAKILQDYFDSLNAIFNRYLNITGQIIY